MNADPLQLPESAGMDPDPDMPVPLWHVVLAMVPGLVLGALIVWRVLS